MSLDWSVVDVEDWKDMQDDEEERYITDSAVWATMALGLNRITEKNIDKWLVRIGLCRVAFGNDWRECLTLAAIERRVGLYTNASEESDAKFKKKVWEHKVRDIESSIRRAREKKEAGNDDV